MLTTYLSIHIIKLSLQCKCTLQIAPTGAICNKFSYDFFLYKFYLKLLAPKNFI